MVDFSSISDLKGESFAPKKDCEITSILKNEKLIDIVHPFYIRFVQKTDKKSLADQLQYLYSYSAVVKLVVTGPFNKLYSVYRRRRSILPRMEKMSQDEMFPRSLELSKFRRIIRSTKRRYKGVKKTITDVQASLLDIV